MLECVRANDRLDRWPMNDGVFLLGMAAGFALGLGYACLMLAMWLRSKRRV
jgi:hypothetical protein